MRIGLDESHAGRIGSEQGKSLIRKIVGRRCLRRALQEERRTVGTVDEQVRQREYVVHTERRPNRSFSASGRIPSKADAWREVSLGGIIEKSASDSRCWIGQVDQRRHFAVLL